MRDQKNIRAVEQLDIDWMGFIFYPQSPRCVKMIPSRAGIIPDYAKVPSINDCGVANKEDTCSSPVRVGVFVDDMPQNIVTRVYNYDLDMVQLHGEESAVACENLRRTIDPDIHPGLKIIKAISIKSAEDVQKYKDYEGAVDYFLFDNKCKMVGGSGNHFDWSVIAAYDGKTPFLLSGGIGPDDVDAIHNFHHPMFLGIDLNSQFEVEPGIKDVSMLREFINKVRI